MNEIVLPPDDNRSVIRTVTFTIAFAFILCVSAMISMAWTGKEIPSELNTIAGTLGGYLTGALSKTTPTAATKAEQIVSSDPKPTIEKEKPKI